MTSLSTDALAAVYREFCQVPTIVSASFISLQKSNVLHLAVEWNQVDLERSEKIKELNFFVIDSSSLKILANPTTPIEIPNECLKNWSKCSLYRAVVRRIANRTEEKQFLEVWKGNCKIINIDVELQEIHGKIYDDSHFGCLQWSNDSRQLVYIAEKKQPKSESFFASSASDKSHTSKHNLVQGDEYLFQEDWGETFLGKCSPVICIFSLETQNSFVLKNFPSDMSLGQAVWTPDDCGIVAVGWHHEPRRLGIIYCSNRRSYIFYSVIGEETCKTISRKNKSVHSPRFSPDGKKLIFVESEVGGPHHKGSRLIMCSWPYNGEIEVLVDLINEPTGSAFPGFYMHLLPQSVWSFDSNYIVIHSSARGQQLLFGINIETKEVIQLSQDDKIGCWNLLDFQDDIMAVSCSAPNMKPFLMLGKFPSNPKTDMVRWVKLTNDNLLIADIKWEIFSLHPSNESINSNFPNLNFNFILVKPHRAGDLNVTPPLILLPHGGPHSCFVSEYTLLVAAFVRIGFALALVNYRGSVGFGENNVYSLLGNIGTQDVADCIQTLNFLIQEKGFDREKVVAFGGSHGGFLVTHLIGQHPNCFKACVCRNPVIDLSSKVDISDIPDWSWVECGLDYDVGSKITPEVLQLMWEHSPIRYIDQVKTPTLVLTGKQDLRVPPSQSVSFYQGLKARGVTVRMNVYEDCHSLSKPAVAADAFMHAVLWFKKHLQF